jgi:hypothetical protein
VFWRIVSSPSSGLLGIITQKAIIHIFTAMKTSNLENSCVFHVTQQGLKTDIYPPHSHHCYTKFNPAHCGASVLNVLVVLKTVWRIILNTLLKLLVSLNSSCSDSFFCDCLLSLQAIIGIVP